jgi:phosphoglycerate dehydrogenase-like enzyme
MKIFCDVVANDDTLALLRRGVAPHELVVPARPTPVLSNAEPESALADADIAFGQPDAESVLQSSKLGWLHISSAGYTRYDTREFRKAASDRKLLVTNSSTVYAEPCAEHVFAFMLAQARKLPEALHSNATGDTPVWLQLRHGSRLLRGQTVLMLGFGSIARHLLHLLQPFQMRIVALRRKPGAHDGVSFITQAELPRALARADHVLNLLPASSDTIRFVSSSEFRAMKKSAVFYNVGRGATVDQDALIAALRSGHIAAAWLDVTDPEPLPSDHPLLNTPNCYITPHIAGGHEHESGILVQHFLDNFRRFLDQKPLLDRIM